MRSAGLLLCIFALGWGLSSAGLTCLQCAGLNDDCVKDATKDTLPTTTSTCGGALSTVCAKFSINYLNGDSYTYRDCAPSNLDEYGDVGIDFCTFIKSVYEPLISQKLIEDVDCYVCPTVECNT